jgi:hypothetical protein
MDTPTPMKTEQACVAYDMLLVAVAVVVVVVAAAMAAVVMVEAVAVVVVVVVVVEEEGEVVVEGRGRWRGIDCKPVARILKKYRVPCVTGVMINSKYSHLSGFSPEINLYRISNAVDIQVVTAKQQTEGAGTVKLCALLPGS